MKRWKKIVLGLGLGVGGLALYAATPCLSGMLRYGIKVRQCPVGEPRLQVQVRTYDLERGREGEISVEANADYMHRWGYADRAPLRRFDAELVLRAGEREIPLGCDWEEDWIGQRSCALTLPAQDLADGDYVLAVSVDSPLDEPVTVEVELPLYSPAAPHVLTDRPLYEPGQEVLFRSLTLRRSDLTPLDDRPGVWKVRSPDGTVLLEERDPGGAWGIADGSFPLAADAATGTWSVEWVSGRDSASAEFQVRPFTLPRFSVEAQADDPWYGIGESPVVTGTVRYSSGAPVGGASISARWAGDGDWPPPTDWLEPFEMIAGPDGRFSASLPPVPADLQGRARLSLDLRATDPAGEQVRSRAGVLLSASPIAVDAVTELADGLVSGFSNRVYLRVTTPDGRPLDGADVTVRRAWDPRDPGESGAADADGVLAMQLDPGEPVNVVIPPKPVREDPSEGQPVFQLVDASSMLRNRSVGLRDRRTLDGLSDALGEACGPLVSSSGQLQLAASIVGGRIRAVLPAESPLERCAAGVLTGAPIGEGRDLYATTWRLQPPEIPRLQVSARSLSQTPNGPLRDAAAEAWSCVADWERGREVPWDLIWQVREGSPSIEVELVEIDAPRGTAAAGPCIRRAFQGLTLDEPSEVSAVGSASLWITMPAERTRQQPRATVRSGYEFEVEVAGVGEATWRAWPGAVPAVRLRPSKILLEPGESFDIEILRGPDFYGELPTEMSLYRGADLVQEIELKEPSRTFTFTPPQGAEGFLRVSWQGAGALVYVRPAASLAMSITPDREVYAPGETATLTVETSSPAVVSLAGVDTALGQLAPLTAPGELAESLVPAESTDPAFEIFDAIALATGQIRGEQAARAAVLRVDQLREVSALSPSEAHTGAHEIEPLIETAAAFYDVLPVARAGVRAWESSAAEGELLTNERMAELWQDALDELERQGAPAEDPWRRPLDLQTLPDELLSRADPRVLVSDATRLPEDVVEWTRWVRYEMN